MRSCVRKQPIKWDVLCAHFDSQSTVYCIASVLKELKDGHLIAVDGKTESHHYGDRLEAVGSGNVLRNLLRRFFIERKPELLRSCDSHGFISLTDVAKQ